LWRNAPDGCWPGIRLKPNEVDTIPTNLPQEQNSFVGRERELDRLRQLVGETRALTLCGAGGIGKTRLALQVLAAVADEFPDGTWFVELGDLRQPDLVVSRVASAVGVGEEPGRPLIETLTDALRPRRLLLALDNCEHLIDACARVCQRLLASSPGLRLITTSREPLHVAAETVWQVPPLTVAPDGTVPGPEDARRYEAIRLFATRAAASLPGFTVGPANAASVATLCRALDGVPLAIELAAAWVRTLSVEQIAARLADRFGLLTTGSRTAPPRQRTLGATIDWSHELLTTREQILLRRLSVFVGWSLEMAEQVCSDDDIPAGDILDLLSSLIDKSLVVLDSEALGQARYRMLDTIREYAAVRLAEAGESAAFRLRLRDYTVAVAEHNFAIGMAQTPAPWSARIDVFRRYDVESGNLSQVLSQCRAGGEVEKGLRLCTAIRPCWTVRGTFAEGGEWLDSFLTADAPATSLRVRGAALVGRAQLALPSAPAVAASWAEEGLALCRAAGDGFWTASALSLLSEIALHMGRADEAASAADEALSIAQAAGDGWNEGYALGIRAAIAGLSGRLREAEQLARSSISVMRRIDQQWGVARALLGLGDLARVRGDPGGAHTRYLEALAILREIDARPEIARCLAGLARVAMDLGSTGQARLHLSESIQLSHSTGSRIGVARGLETFAALAVSEDRPELTVQLTAAAAALREAAGFPALAGARVERYLASARGLGEPAVAQLWAQGLAMTGEAAVALALDVQQPADGGRDTVVLTAVGTYEAAAALPGMLTPRECQVAALVADGHSNKAIAEELFISPATAARHVANILAKLGFSSRTQIAAWAAARQLEQGDGAAAAPDRRAPRGASRAGQLRIDTRRGLPEPGVIMTAHPDRPRIGAGGRWP
jgi:predicted ATPase/DNA-binding CsgD family transcriptional regulator